MENIRLQMELLRNIKTQKSVKSDYSVFCAVAIYMHKKEGINYSFTPKTLYNEMLKKPVNERVKDSEIKGIKEGLEELKDKGWITYEKQGTSYIITESNVFNDNDGTFFVVPLKHINNILQQKGKMALLHHYLFLLSTINLKSKVGFTSRESIAKSLGVATEKTITTRNKKLEELGAIKFTTRKAKDSNNHYINMTNVYSLPENNEELESYKQESVTNKTNEINEQIAEQDKNNDDKLVLNKRMFSFRDDDDIDEARYRATGVSPF